MKTAFLKALKVTLWNNRTKSFLWRTGMMVLAVLINQVITLLSSSSFPAFVTVLLGLVLGEISKFISQSLSTPA